MAEYSVILAKEVAVVLLCNVCVTRFALRGLLRTAGYGADIRPIEGEENAAQENARIDGQDSDR